MSLFVLRLATGAFLIYGVADNILSAGRMAEFVSFMRLHGFTNAEIWAPVTIITQLLAGVLLVIGLLTRLAGATVMATFVVALIMVHWNESFREWWPGSIADHNRRRFIYSRWRGTIY